MNDINWAQDSISSRFQNGKLVIGTLLDLLDGKLEPHNLPMMKVSEYRGLNFAVDGNRRLWVLRRLHEHSPEAFSQILVQVVAWNKKYANKWTTTCNGCEIKFKPSEMVTELTANHAKVRSLEATLLEQEGVVTVLVISRAKVAGSPAATLLERLPELMASRAEVRSLEAQVVELEGVSSELTASHAKVRSLEAKLLERKDELMASRREVRSLETNYARSKTLLESRFAEKTWQQPKQQEVNTSTLVSGAAFEAQFSKQQAEAARRQFEHQDFTTAEFAETGSGIQLLMCPPRCQQPEPTPEFSLLDFQGIWVDDSGFEWWVVETAAWRTTSLPGDNAALTIERDGSGSWRVGSYWLRDAGRDVWSCVNMLCWEACSGACHTWTRRNRC